MPRMEPIWPPSGSTDEVSPSWTIEALEAGSPPPITFVAGSGPNCWFIATRDENGEPSRISEEVFVTMREAIMAHRIGLWTPA